jgi:hypothetical protein
MLWLIHQNAPNLIMAVNPYKLGGLASEVDDKHIKAEAIPRLFLFCFNLAIQLLRN